MFRFAPQARVFWPITLEARNPETGEIAEGRAYVLYSLLTREELRARQRELTQTIASRITTAKTAEDLQQIIDDQLAIDRKYDDELVKHIHGWKEVNSNDDQPLPFDETTLRAMLADPLLHKAFAQGLLDASNGAKTKNSSPGPAGTPARGQK